MATKTFPIVAAGALPKVLLVFLVGGRTSGAGRGFHALGLALAGDPLGGDTRLKPRLDLGLALGPFGDEPPQSDQKLPHAAGG